MPVEFTREGWKCDICKMEYNTFEDAISTPICRCQPTTRDAKMKHCSGCYNEHYNQYDKGCWSLSGMFLQWRKRVHASDVPPWKHEPGKYPSCYRQQMHVFAKEDQEN